MIFTFTSGCSVNTNIPFAIVETIPFRDKIDVYTMLIESTVGLSQRRHYVNTRVLVFSDDSVNIDAEKKAWFYGNLETERRLINDIRSVLCPCKVLVHVYSLN